MMRMWNVVSRFFSKFFAFTAGIVAAVIIQALVGSFAYSAPLPPCGPLLMENVSACSR